MSTKGFGSAVVRQSVAGLIAIAASPLGVLAVEPGLAATDQRAGHSQTVQPQLAQAVETGCRQTNSVTGIYTQPSLESSSRGVLTSGQIVRLELIGTGTGWARITQPAIGWVEAKYLSPPVTCGSLSNSLSNSLGNTASTTSQAPAVPSPQPTAPASPQPMAPSATRTVTVVCEVLPTEGLVVRSEPSIATNTALYTIPKGAHQFQFTNNHLTTRSGNLERQWAYITAPYPGWISLGVVGAGFNLGGRECG